MSNTKICPFCGEEIQSAAKKCRYCGEWLTESEMMVSAPEPAVVETLEAVPMEVATPAEGSFPANNPQYNVMPNMQQPLMQGQQPVMPGTQGGQTVMMAGGQPIVLNNVVQVEQHQHVEQNVEQTVVVTSSGSGDSESSGWLYTEMWIIAAGIGFAMKSWWWFLGTAIIGSFLLMIPYIGAVMCVLLGAAWGLLAAAIGAAFFSTSAAWVLGLIVGGGAIYGHLEARKREMED